MERYLVGVDVGTTGTKAILISENGREVSHAYIGYPTYTPDTFMCEQDADELWNAVADTVRRVSDGVEDKEAIVGISLSTQGGTLIATDGKFDPVYRAIVWSDKSCDPERALFIKESGVSQEELHRKTGWNLSHGLPLLQIRRLHDRMRPVYDKSAYFLSVPDFVSARMTGIPAVDLSNAGINELTDIRKREYDPSLCAFARVRTPQLGQLTESGTPIGRLTPEAAKRMGLTESTVLAAGAHDQYAVALGAGLTEEGDILIGSGTSWVVTAIGDQPDFGSGLSQSVPAVPGKWGSLLSLSYGGACLEWLRKNVMAAPDGSVMELRDIDEKCRQARAAEDGLFFYPFSGKLSDGLPESTTRAVFLGLDVSHDKYDMALAVMEGVAFQIKWMCESFREISENGIRLTGGAAKSALWTQIIADVLGKPVRLSRIPDMACIGAAVMAGVGAGVYATAEEGVKRMAQRESAVYPDPRKAERYREAFETYKKRAAALASL